MRAAEWFDNYLSGKLNGVELQEFESRLQSDAIFFQAFEKHKAFIHALNQQENQAQLKAKLKSIHQNEFGNDAKMISIKPESFFKRHSKTFAVAASVGAVAVLSTVALLSAGGYLLKKQSSELTDLKRDVSELKYSQGAIIEGIKSSNAKRIKNYMPASIEGTAFAINNKGYFITSWHMVKNADSVFVTNAFIDRQSAKLVFSEPSLDVAIYKINNDKVLEKFNVPFSFKSNDADIGEKVYTLGFPRKDIVYGEGSVSALSGFNGDTTMYQISVPVNPGNSGGPIIDEQGNVIGLIKGKQISAEGTSFAIKLDLIKEKIDQLENDSLKKEIAINLKKTGSLKGLKRTEQIKKIQPFVFNVMVYK